jgi:hypothetical protein
VRRYFLLEDILFLNKLNGAEHALIVDGGESGDDLKE